MSELMEIYRAEQLPVFQNCMYNNLNEAVSCVKGDVILVQDKETGLIFNRAFRPELMQYDANYQNEQALSSTFRIHLNEISKIIKRHFHDYTLIEIGCGKGYFLEHLHALGFKITGLDPTYQGQNPHILKRYFNSELGLHAKGIILRHVLEHVQNPVDFLIDILDSNGGEGKIYIEVPCFDWICKRKAWFDIFYEHVNYFRISDFIRIFGRIHEIGHCFGGQYLYVVADLSTIRKPNELVEDNFVFPSDFTDSVEYYANMLKIKGTEKNDQYRSVIWGGASKGVIFAFYMLRAGARIDYVVDINPAKQGKYLAGTGLRVSTPQEIFNQVTPGTDIFVMNGNYLSEIRKLTKNKFNYLTVDHEII